MTISIEMPYAARGPQLIHQCLAPPLSPPLDNMNSTLDSSQTFSAFQRRLKTHLFQAAFITLPPSEPGPQLGRDSFFGFGAI